MACEIIQVDAGKCAKTTGGTGAAQSCFARHTLLSRSRWRRANAGQAAEAIRKHWGIENKLHYTRDVTLCEDASRIRRNPGIFARIRSFAYNILRLHHRPGSLRRRAWRPQIRIRHELL